MAKVTAVAHPHRLETVRVDQLVTGLNVRTDATPDADFIASVKANGILQPPTVRPLDDGTFEIVIGNRRANAAAKAGLEEIEVLVIDDALAESRRLIEQLVENDQRRSLTEGERTAGYQQLELFSVSPADIAKALGVKRERVDLALKVAGSERAATLVASGAVTLEHAAAIIEFDQVAPDIADRLAEVATTHPANFVHQLQKAQDELLLVASKNTLTKDLEEAGVKILDHRPTWAESATILEVDRLYRDLDLTTPLANEADTNPGPGTPGLSAYLHVDWINPAPEPDDDADETTIDAYEDGYVQQYVAEYYIDGWQEAGFFAPRRNYQSNTPDAATTATPDPAEDEAAKAERRKVIANNKAWPAATEIRRKWITETLLAAKKLPDDTATLIAQFLSSLLPKESYNVNLNTALTWLGIEGDTWAPRRAGLHLQAHRSEGLRVALAITLAAIEDQLNDKDSWRFDTTKKALYLATLATWGYGLSDLEQRLVDDDTTEKAPAAA